MHLQLFAFEKENFNNDKCFRTKSFPYIFILSKFVLHQKLYDMFIFDNSCLIYEKDISLHYTIGKFIISILRIRCKGNITIILKQTAKALLHLCHSECLVNLQKSKHQHSTASPPIINHFEMKL